MQEQVTEKGELGQLPQRKLDKLIQEQRKWTAQLVTPLTLERLGYDSQSGNDRYSARPLGKAFNVTRLPGLQKQES